MAAYPEERQEGQSSFEAAMGSLAQPNAQTPPPGAAMQPANAQVPPEIMPGPPRTPEEREHRKQGWAAVIDRFQTDPNLQLMLLRMGTQMLQPIQPGQTPLGHTGQAIQGSVDYLTGLREQQRQADLKERESQRLERESVANVRGTTATAAATELKTDLGKALFGDEVMKSAYSVRSAHQAAQAAQNALDVFDSQKTAGLHTPEEQRRRAELEVRAKESTIAAQTARSEYERIHGQNETTLVNAQAAELYARMREHEQKGSVRGLSVSRDPEGRGWVNSWIDTRTGLPGSMSVTQAMSPADAQRQAKADAKAEGKENDTAYIEARRRQLMQPKVEFFGSVPDELRKSFTPQQQPGAAATPGRDPNRVILRPDQVHGNAAPPVVSTPSAVSQVAGTTATNLPPVGGAVGSPPPLPSSAAQVTPPGGGGRLATPSDFPPAAAQQQMGQQGIEFSAQAILNSPEGTPDRIQQNIALIKTALSELKPSQPGDIRRQLERELQVNLRALTLSQTMPVAQPAPAVPGPAAVTTPPTTEQVAANATPIRPVTASAVATALAPPANVPLAGREPVPVATAGGGETAVGTIRQPGQPMEAPVRQQTLKLPTLEKAPLAQAVEVVEGVSESMGRSMAEQTRKQFQAIVASGKYSHTDKPLIQRAIASQLLSPQELQMANEMLRRMR